MSPTAAPARLLRAARAVWDRAVGLWRAVRAWRRISFTAGGVAFTLGTFAVGFAALNTGNNLLYLLLGAMLGFIAVSGWLSERAIRGLEIRRGAPRAVTVGQDLRITYQVTNHKPRFPSLAVEIGETGLPERAFLAFAAPRDTVEVRSVNSFVRRGIYPLGTVTLSTRFPFGLFRKERDVHLPGEVVVRPRTDRPVPELVLPGGLNARGGAAAATARGPRGEYRSLREFRPGDDTRDIHWRATARAQVPIVREYQADGAHTLWIVLNTDGPPGEAAEVAVEVAAAVAADATAASRPFALMAGETLVPTGEGPGHLETVLDALARVDFEPGAPAPPPPVPPSRCLLVSVEPRPGYGAVIAVGSRARLRPVA